jgi:PAS domain-containing protein
MMGSLENTSMEFALGKLRIAQLEREAIERSSDAAKGLREHLDRYQSLVLAIAQVIWTSDPQGEMVGEQPSWASYTGQTLEQYQRGGWHEAVHPDDRAKDLEVCRRARTVRIRASLASTRWCIPLLRRPSGAGVRR